MVNELPEGTDAPADQKRFRVVKEIVANQYIKESLRPFLPPSRMITADCAETALSEFSGFEPGTRQR
jgi:hypothetical protein